jgi:nicotinamide riboside kinase
MNILSCLLLLLTYAFAQNLTPEEQRRLIEENKFLKAEILKCKSIPSSEDSKRLMETLQRGKTFQEEQNKALKELDEEL